jgi:peptidoglycan/LPS O-acetylase OafA/YrhL
MNKLQHLEGIRGLAALQVMLVHLNHMRDSTNQSLSRIGTFYQPQNFAVAIFFVLSGRILTLSALRKCDSGRITSSVIRRMFRLTFPVIGVMIINWLLYATGCIMLMKRDRFISSLWWDMFIKPLNLIFNDGRVTEPVPGTAWTLAKEFSGSFAVYMATLVLVSFPAGCRTRWMVLVSLFAFNLLFHSWLAHFFAGLMLAELDVSGALTRYSKWRWSVALNLLISLAVTFIFMQSDYTVGKETLAFLKSLQIDPSTAKNGVRDIFWQENISVLFITSAILFVTETTSSLQYFFSLPPFVYLGRISFMTYLFHVTVYDDFGRLFYAKYPDRTPLETVGLILAMLLLVIFASEALTVFIDTPSVQLSSWIENEVLRNTEWAFIDIVYSIPRWPLGIFKFFYFKTRIVIINIYTFVTLFSPINMYKQVFGQREKTSLPTLDEVYTADQQSSDALLAKGLPV